MNDEFRPRQPGIPPRPAPKPKRRTLLLAAPRKVHWWLKKLTRKQQIILGVVVSLLVLGGILWLQSKSNDEPTTENSSIVEKEEPIPTTVPSRMTGREVARELNDLPVTAVMIENSPDARPQSGLLNGDMIFEAIAEGGITRFVVLYQESQPEYIGPVRSVRPYYLDFVASFDAAIAHAGGSAEALAQIRADGIKDMDHGANGASFQRVSNRYAPHNLYTSRAKLLEIHQKRGYTSSSYQSFDRKADSPVPTPNARMIDFNISSFLYNPHYAYDSATNSYMRAEGGKPHTDERSGNQLNPKVVIALVMSRSQDGIYSEYRTNGSGVAYVFQDGTVQQVTWEKANRRGELMLKDANGARVALNAGQTWISLVADSGRVTYAP